MELNNLLFCYLQFPMDDNTLEQLKLELNCRLEEYRALRAEIVSTLTSAYQTTNLTLIAIGVVISGSKFTLETPILLISASLVFNVLLWTQLRYEQAVLNMSNHIITTVTPAIRKILEDISHRENLNTLLSWESSGREHNHSDDVFLYPIEGARYGLPLLSAIFTFFAYLIFCYVNNQFSYTINILLSGLNFILVIYSVVVVFKVRAMLRG
jgi:hypothetical protein